MDTLALPDGRSLDFQISGPDGGSVILFHHGTPGSLLASRRIERVAHAQGHRLLTYSRAGYGGSSPRPGRRVVDVAEDMAALLDHVGVDRCVTAGWSGGGPHSLAVAARLADRVTGALVIAGVAPHDATGLDFTAGMGEDNIEEFGAAREGEDAVRAFIEVLLPQLRGTTPEGVVEALGSVLPDVDRAVLTDEAGADMVANFQEALRIGPEGWIEDDLAFVQDWGFELDEISIPTFVWQGSLDLMVPYAHGEWLGQHVPGIKAHLIEGEGHLSIGLGATDQMIAEVTATLA
ncbi:alpha/beta fold hydrolase [Luteipulveratus mongoliensis]|uniref:AB hydrolase-1 domain-containing protein n=1 Tax=Luteipulveratus mongoliensis TaxID=571913 RepID=A0A0K1JL13_9MICO|nr:alpha/beta hydrolase [Luteipulveratus mongoliensis]AKU17419.1 hypothetical protein VV02_18835 [Luteipulveratus mongoliensis]